MNKYIIYIFTLFLSLFLWSCQQESFSPTYSESDLSSINSENIQSSKSSNKGGSALNLDGSTGYVEIPDDASLDVTDEFTITAWVYLRSYTEWASIATKGNNNYTIHQSGPVGGSDYGHLRFTGSSPELPLYLESDTRIPLNEWHHIAVTYDGEYLTFYFDGATDGGGVLPGPLSPNDGPLIIGADFPGAVEFWNGALDEIKIWKEALSRQHVRTSMRGAATPKARSLVGYWRFDEGSGQTANDRSRYDNDGTLTGGVSFVNPDSP